ncbi:hypothetical protein FV232_04700 [Methylobacterium sp. WL30]|uniref:hypothetical protein n=1 Tax=unclassified Methylobacterium TaxID=2615210 RepID=UPI0011C96628|nr:MULTISPECIES: hypothetical protein [unclassified Methylobacterium]TXN41553.1 hypothetical protein FV225_02110 [Methylobacterium sp. WL93]TXN52438.1 hypothetical protein FV227_03070 [Methylobacterium sp. WL119]TXN69757.1 hypothetical protein FV232_04700 [Methylobacterium sp. WL30]
MNDRRHTAIYEDGHAVIGRVLTMACGWATIKADDDSAGHSITADPSLILFEWDRRGKWRGTASKGMRSVFVGRILTFMAGTEAETAILGSSQGGDAEDRCQITLMLYEIEPEKQHEAREDRLRRAARALVRRHRADIERVAEALMAREVLTGEEIDAILPPGFMARPNVWNDFMAVEAEASDFP